VRGGDPRSLTRILTQLARLKLRAGRHEDAAGHLREALQISTRTGDRIDLLDGLDWCGYLCAATGRPAEAVTVWGARAALHRQGEFTDPPVTTHRRHEPLHQARQALGPARTRAAEDRGAAMSPATAAEYALLLSAPGLQPQEPPELAGLSAGQAQASGISSGGGPWGVGAGALLRARPDPAAAGAGLRSRWQRWGAG
jgi:hypothetical protein